MTEPAEPDRAPAAHVTDHVAVGLDRLAEPLRRRPIVRALASTYLAQLQDVEDEAWAVYSDNVDTAVGARLDVYGRLVGVDRNGLEDETYRTRIRMQIAVLRSDGTGPELMALMHIWLAEGQEFTYEELRPATVIVEVLVGVADAAEAIKMLRRARAGGVRLQLIAPPGGPSDTYFSFAESGLYDVPDDDEGWEDLDDPDIGGLWVDVFE